MSGSGGFGGPVGGGGGGSIPRGSGSGMQGFAGRGEITMAELDFEPEFEMQPVRGLRQWSLVSPDLRRDPHDGVWIPGALTGATGWSWPDGVLEAYCNNGRDHPVPTETDQGGACGCGFWAYWDMLSLAANRFGSGTGIPVIGIIDGYGRVLIGEKGFRSQRAKITALAPAFSILAEVAPAAPYQQSPLVAGDPYLAFAEQQKRDEERAEIQRRAQQHADAWMAMIQDRLTELYPGARVYATASGMLAVEHTGGRPPS